MADDEKIAETAGKEAEEEEIVVDVRKVKKKPSSRKSTKRRKRRKKITKTTSRKKEGENAVSVDMLLLVFLGLSLLLNLYFFYENGVLKGEVEKLKAGTGIGGPSASVMETMPPVASGGEEVRVEFYVMSQCPYGTQVEDAIKPVLDKLGDAVDFTLDYIVSDNGDGTFRSLHGQNEVDGNIIQLCAAKHYPGRYMELVVCMNKDMRSIPDNWEDCAGEIGLDSELLNRCFESEEGDELLSESAKAAVERNAMGSPTIYINDELYRGGRRSEDFLRAICDKYETKPEACKNIPPPVAVLAVTLSDKRCQECEADVVMIKTQLSNMFPGMVFKSLDYGSKEGKQLYSDLKLKYLPAILVNESIKDAGSYNSVSRYLTKRGDYYDLAVGAVFDPTKEICDNEVDDTGNNRVDCDDPDCKEDITCRPEIEKKLDLFVMSMCPFGTRALDAMKDVLENFGEDIDFDVHYIASYNENTGVFDSLHGQPEVDENIRQVCAIKHYPEDYGYMEYIWCRNRDMEGSWEDCVEEAGMDVETMKACFEGDEGKELLREDLKFAQNLMIGASPTWLANNREIFSGIDAETVRKNYCSANPGLGGCENELSTVTGDAVSAGSCE